MDRSDGPDASVTPTHDWSRFVARTPRIRSGREGMTMRRMTSMMPPRIALFAILAMLVLHVTVPLAVMVPVPFSYMGLGLMAVGVAMIVWSRRAFQAAATPIKPFTESTALIRHGLYRWSRNPMYVGAVLLVTGIAVLLGS